jgi:putative transposase
MLRREGIRVGEKRVERLMRSVGLQGAHRRRRKGCTIPVPGVEPFADLVGRTFRPEAPNRVWCADLKQIRTGEGWLYLAAVRDLFSRRIVGWSMAAHMRQELVVDALTMAVKARKPEEGTIHHSDHGGQFIGLTFGQTCHDAGIAQSMGAVGTCYDNAVAETFFATLTKERLLHDPPPAGRTSRAQLWSAIFEYIEGFYNPTRLHSTLGMRSPVEYEEDHAAGDPDGLAREKIVDNLRLPTITTTTMTWLHQTGGGSLDQAKDVADRAAAHADDERATRILAGLLDADRELWYLEDVGRAGLQLLNGLDPATQAARHELREQLLKRELFDARRTHEWEHAGLLRINLLPARKRRMVADDCSRDLCPQLEPTALPQRGYPFSSGATSIGP